MRLREVRIKSFKSIVDQTIALGRVNCFIGANGVGKSNVLEALGVLGAAAGGHVDDEAILRRGVRAGLPRLFKASFVGGKIAPHIFMEAKGQPDATYRVSLLNPLERPEPAWSFKSELLQSASEPPRVKRGPRGKKQLNLEASAGLAALRVVELQPDDPSSLLMKALQGYAIYTPNTPALRATAQDPQTRPPFGLVGGGLADGFESLKRELDEVQLDETLELIDWACDVGAIDSAGALLSPSVPRAKSVLRFTDRFMAPSRNKLTAYDASEGALYVLFAAILCLSPASPSVFAIDNFDSALNPRLVARLVERLGRWLTAGDADRQILFTAHNPTVLDGLDLSDDEIRLFAVERNSLGHTVVRRITLTPSCRNLTATTPSRGCGPWETSERCPMSDLRVALVAEGPTDAIVIEAALKALLPRPFVLTQLQPEPTRPKLGTGWGGVLHWCLDFAARGHTRLEDDPTLPGFDLFVVHIDADVAQKRYADVSDKIADLAAQRGWPPLPNVIPCPPPSGSADLMRTCLLAWAGMQEPGPNTVLCVPSKAVEAWLTAAAVENGHALQNGLECNLNVEAQLRALPIAQRIRKTVRDYRARERTIADAWFAVRQRCTQAERFSTEVAAVGL